MTARRTAFLLVGLVAVYLLFAGLRGWELIRSGEPVAVAMGLAVLVLPVVGAWLVWREVVFGLGTEAMAHRLADEGGLPVDDLPRMPSGRVVGEAADERYEQRRAEVDAAPEDWRAWYRLAVAYDDARDRRRARAAMRHALALFRAEPG